jgi:SAM-dependent methyltransferase
MARANVTFEAVRRDYAVRDARSPLADWRRNVYHPRHPLGRLFSSHNREALVDAVNTLAIDLDDFEVLDVGCGTGHWLRHFVELGADPQHLTGVDLSKERLALAARMNPGIRWLEIDGPLPFGDATFDLVMQTLVFSSIPEEAARRTLAREMLRVVKPAGLLLWVDLRPGASRLATFDRDDVERYFPGTRLVYGRPVQPRYFRRLYRRPGLATALSRLTTAGCESLLVALRRQAEPTV